MAFIEPVCTADTSDADIIRVCEQHIANHKAYNAMAGVVPLEDDPRWHAYERTLAAVSEVRPSTLAGLAAKARAAKVDATHPNGEEVAEDALEWAWDLVNDLIRLDETPGPDAELIAACNEYLRIERAFEAAYAAHDGEMDGDHPAMAMLDPIPALTEQIIALRATMPEGITARAKCAAFHYLPSHSACQDDPSSSDGDRFETALLRDMVAMERCGR